MSVLTVFACGALLPQAPPEGLDWPQWRGPNRAACMAVFHETDLLAR